MGVFGKSTHNHKLSDFLMTAYRQWSFYLYLIEHHHGHEGAIPKVYLSENHFLKGFFDRFPNHPPYLQMKDYRLGRIEKGGQVFSRAYGWIIAMERGELENLPVAFGITKMPGF